MICLPNYNGSLSASIVRSIVTKPIFLGLSLLALLPAGQSKLKADVIVDASIVDRTIREIKAAHFLIQATMGPTEQEIAWLRNQMGRLGDEEAMDRWITNQFSQTPLSLYENARNMLDADGIAATNSTDTSLDLAVWNYRYYTWWDLAMNSNAQLHERMSWALAQIFVANDGTSRNTWVRSVYYQDALRRHTFGNYRDLLEEITYHTVMGEFLSFSKNDKGDPALGIYPDENYAREIMQLFSIGVYKVNARGRLQTDSNGQPIENYTNEDITELAKVFTGLAPNPRNANTMTFESTIGSSYNDPMIMWDHLKDPNDNHHYVGPKTFLGQTIPSGQGGDQDISDALDILLDYSTTAPFIAHRLIQRFTTSTPSVNYIGRVADAFRDNGSGVRGDFKAVIRAILMDPEARDSLTISQTVQPDGKVLISVDSNNALHGRLREPALLMAHFLRYFEVESLENGTEGYFKPANLRSYTQQAIAAQVSVFNYYNADFLPTDGPAAGKKRTGANLALPEFELLPSSAIPLTEGIRAIANSLTVQQRATDLSEDAVLTKLSAHSDIDETKTSFAWLVDKINLDVFYGSMPDSLRTELIAALDDLEDTTQEDRFANAIAILLNSADFAVVN